MTSSFESPTAGQDKDMAVILARLDELKALLEEGKQEYLSIQSAGKVTGLSAAHIRRAVTGGTLPCSNVGTMDRPTYRIARADLAAWMEKRKGGAFPPPRRRGRQPIPKSRHH